jgi:hypothetical protein
MTLPGIDTRPVAAVRAATALSYSAAALVAQGICVLRSKANRTDNSEAQSGAVFLASHLQELLSKIEAVEVQL